MTLFSVSLGLTKFLPTSTQRSSLFPINIFSTSSFLELRNTVSSQYYKMIKKKMALINEIVRFLNFLQSIINHERLETNLNTRMENAIIILFIYKVKK